MLAIDGGPKAVDAPEPHFVWPEITAETQQAVLQQLSRSISIYNRSGIIRELEERIERFCSVAHALSFNSGTSAIFAMYWAAGLRYPDEVICPVYTFPATVSPLMFTGARPVFVDCEIDGNIAPAEIERKISSRTRAVVVAHMWGVPARMEQIVDLCRRHNLLLLEDASHAFGAVVGDRHVGTFGDAAAISLQGQKVLTGGEGGLLITNSDTMYNEAQLLGHYNKRCLEEIPQHYPGARFAATGYGLKLRIHPLAAAVALQQLDVLDDILSMRQRISTHLTQRLLGIENLEIPVPREDVKCSWYAFAMRSNLTENRGVALGELVKALNAEGCSLIDSPGSIRLLCDYPLFQRPRDVFQMYRYDDTHEHRDFFPMARHVEQVTFKMPVWHKLHDLGKADMYANAIRKVFDHIGL